MANMDRMSRVLSVTSVDDASFVSAQDTVADMRDFEEDLGEIMGEIFLKSFCFYVARNDSSSTSMSLSLIA